MVLCDSAGGSVGWRQNSDAVLYCTVLYFVMREDGMMMLACLWWTEEGQTDSTSR